MGYFESRLAPAIASETSPSLPPFPPCHCRHKHGGETTRRTPRIQLKGDCRELHAARKGGENFKCRSTSKREYQPTTSTSSSLELSFFLPFFFGIATDELRVSCLGA